ncbi:uncharacterized protein LOC128547262 [Mercenaria mercenaria]|uniref:uncharacterized protein LOC128547262 n=1 Tax=Mercenaria mercenaria TaxID=6596 RepID=UPI00234E4E28|nr:uncharacterized protein LOC128547262 [Mercenaria mercenaria]
MRGKYKALEAENEFLNEQITELLQRMETVAASGGRQESAVDVESQRQVIALMKKVEKYRAMLNEKDAMVEQISAKASSRIHKLETNWKKADAEVCRFDELVDTVRAVLVENKTAMEDKQLAKLIELIDGREQLSAFDKERKQAALKPVKTARWLILCNHTTVLSVYLQEILTLKHYSRLARW